MKKLLITLGCAIAVGGLAGVLVLNFAPRVQSGVERTVILSEADWRALATALWQSATTEQADLPLTPGFAGVKNARLFLSASDGEEQAVIAEGRGSDLKAAGEAALKAMQELAKDFGGRPLKHMKVHLVVGPGVEQVLDRRRGLTREPSLHALSFPKFPEVTLLPEEVIAFDLVDRVQKDQVLDVKDVERHLKSQGRLPQKFKEFADATRREVVQLPVEAWYVDAAGALPTYRGHRLYSETLAELPSAIDLASRYLVNAVGDDGGFVYNYVAKRGAGDDDYNVLRHAGTIYAMLEIEAVHPQVAQRQAAERAIAWLEKRVEPCVSPDTAAACVVEDNATKLGGNALFIVALAKHAQVTGSKEKLALMQRLALRFVSVQDPATGEFKYHKQRLPGGQATSFVSNYYPGEAILGLMRLHQLDPDPRWLDTAAKAALYLIDTRDAGKSVAQIEHDHWLLYALNDLYRARQEPKFMAHAKKIVAAITEAQNGDDPLHPDWRGGFYDEPRSTPAATRVEGLMAAFRLFKDHGEPAAAAGALAVARAGARFQLAAQLREEQAMYFPDPAFVLGGVGEGLTAWEIRIDYVQHAVSGLLALASVEKG